MEIRKQNQAETERAWRRRVRDDYRKFWEQHPDLTEADLIGYTGLSVADANKIRRGENISANPTCYAILHHHCGIKSADPRHIPARYYNPQGSSPTLAPRSWSQGKYLEWVIESGNPVPFIYLEQQNQEETELAEVNIEYLLRMLERVSSQSAPEVRDRFVNRHWDKLRDLLTLIEVLLLERGERERILRIGEQLDIRSLSENIGEVLNGED